MQYVESMEVWVRRNRSEAYRNIAKAPISVRWVDVNSEDDESPNYRSRWQGGTSPTNIHCARRRGNWIASSKYWP